MHKKQEVTSMLFASLLSQSSWNSSQSSTKRQTKAFSPSLVFGAHLFSWKATAGCDFSFSDRSRNLVQWPRRWVDSQVASTQRHRWNFLHLRILSIMMRTGKRSSGRELSSSIASYSSTMTARCEGGEAEDVVVDISPWWLPGARNSTTSIFIALFLSLCLASWCDETSCLSFLLWPKRLFLFSPSTICFESDYADPGMAKRARHHYDVMMT